MDIPQAFHTQHVHNRAHHLPSKICFAYKIPRIRKYYYHLSSHQNQRPGVEHGGVSGQNLSPRSNSHNYIYIQVYLPRSLSCSSQAKLLAVLHDSSVPLHVFFSRMRSSSFPLAGILLPTYSWRPVQGALTLWNVFSHFCPHTLIINTSKIINTSNTVIS